MAGNPEEMARRFEQQAQVQREQLDMIRTQQESIDTLKQMLSQLLRIRRRSRRPRLLPISPVANGRKGRARLLRISRRRDSLTPSHPSFRLKREATQRMGALILKE